MVAADAALPIMPNAAAPPFHRQHRPLAFVKARQEKRYDRVLDIVGIEIGGNGRAKTFDGVMTVVYPQHAERGLFTSVIPYPTDFGLSCNCLLICLSERRIV
jgi:hypothetical protein